MVLKTILWMGQDTTIKINWSSSEYWTLLVIIHVPLTVFLNIKFKSLLDSALSKCSLFEQIIAVLNYRIDHTCMMVCLCADVSMDTEECANVPTCVHYQGCIWCLWPASQHWTQIWWRCSIQWLSRGLTESLCPSLLTVIYHTWTVGHKTKPLINRCGNIALIK